MKAVEHFSSRHPENPAFFEWFCPPAESGAGEVAAGFDVKLQRSGQVLHVPEDRTILDVLEEHGYALACSCREGMCRTCETGVIDGVPDHRDFVLSGSERAASRTMMICVSRAKGPMLVLDV
jgi:vanillate O-demethylase ferredoxin subunit